uniref:Uncharacterized protein n=1 Tax=Anopheles farauti TaxID=69004 RepID=A0A182QNK2_9DIPT
MVQRQEVVDGRVAEAVRWGTPVAGTEHLQHLLHVELVRLGRFAARPELVRLELAPRHHHHHHHQEQQNEIRSVPAHPSAGSRLPDRAGQCVLPSRTFDAYSFALTVPFFTPSFTFTTPSWTPSFTLADRSPRKPLTRSIVPGCSSLESASARSRWERCSGTDLEETVAAATTTSTPTNSASPREPMLDAPINDRSKEREPLTANVGDCGLDISRDISPAVPNRFTTIIQLIVRRALGRESATPSFTEVAALSRLSFILAVPCLKADVKSSRKRDILLVSGDAVAFASGISAGGEPDDASDLSPVTVSIGEVSTPAAISSATTPNNSLTVRISLASTIVTNAPAGHLHLLLRMQIRRRWCGGVGANVTRLTSRSSKTGKEPAANVRTAGKVTVPTGFEFRACPKGS